MEHEDDILSSIGERAADWATRTDHPERRVAELPPPLNDKQLDEAEQRLGFEVPPFLAGVYRRVANGGFGPGYGLLSLIGHSSTAEDPTVVELYEELSASDPNDPYWQWPLQLLPIGDWGCAIYSCVDCSTVGGPVVTFDPSQRQAQEPTSKSFARTKYDVATWLHAWTSGARLWDAMFEPSDKPRTGINPFTGKTIQIPMYRFKR